jgi:signal transduction histidine kinase
MTDEQTAAPVPGVAEPARVGGGRPAVRPPSRHRWRNRLSASGANEARESGSGVRQPDALDAFNPAIVIVRWGTLVVGLLLASSDLDRPRIVGIGGLLLAYTVYRTLRPLRYTDDTRSFLLVVAELAGTALALSATGYWASPYAFSVLTAVAVAGFARGLGVSLRLAVVTCLAVTIPWAVDPGFGEDQLRTSVQWAVEVLLVAVVSGYARRISGEADRRQSLALDRLGRLADANSLLFSLHQVAQTLPASLDLDEVLDSTAAQLRDLFDHEAAAILLLDDTDHRWHVVRREGTRPPARLSTEELPPPLARALRLRSLVAEPNLLAAGGPGLAPITGSGIYAVLPARNSTIGLVSIEHGTAHHFTPRDIELLSGFVEPAALAIDNARWFARLRTVGADEERTRIARDLHDRIGQSLAYLAFELDRIVKSKTLVPDDPTSKALDQLRTDVRGVIREVRDTLYDLRTDVSETQSLPSTLEAFLHRVRDRSGLETHLRAQETGRLPILQERELWRVAQEAVTNVERHAKANQVTVTWWCDGRRAILQVSDDGKGFPIGKAGRLDSYGLVGMRERASSIGATLSVESQPGRGTRVRCVLETS